MACLLEDGLEVMFSQVLELNEIKIFLLEIVINVPAYFTLLWLGSVMNQTQKWKKSMTLYSEMSRESLADTETVGRGF